MSKKNRLGWILTNIIPDEKYIPKLLNLLKDNTIGDEIALCLAKLKYKEATPTIIDCFFKKGNSFPNGYGKALIEFNDDSNIDTLIAYSKKIKSLDENELLISNIAYVLCHFDISPFLNQIMELSNSKKRASKILAIKLLEGNNSPEGIKIICDLLDDDDEKIQKQAIYCLGERVWPYKKEITSTPDIIEKAFKQMGNNNIGSYFSYYLKDLNSDSINRRAYQEISSIPNSALKINLANIIYDKYFSLSKNIILEHLKEFKPEYEDALHQCLFLNISDFSKEIIPLINKKNKLRTRFIISNYSNESDDVSNFITSKTCSYLLNKWEENITANISKNEDSYYWCYSIPRFLSLCSNHLKSSIISKVNDEDYNTRYQLLSIVIYLKLRKQDFSETTLNWLFEKMTNEKSEHKNFATSILGDIGDENFAKKKLIPLLESKNPILRNNAYIAIEKIEKSLNKRLIIK